MKSQTHPLVGLVMGSQSDWPTMKFAADILIGMEVPFEKKVVSAHRTPDLLSSYAKQAADCGIKIIIAGAGGAAHLPGMLAANTIIPVLGVPVKTASLGGIDSLLSIVQMPKGIPVATLAIGTSGAANAALLSVSILGLSCETYAHKLTVWRDRQSQQVIAKPVPGEEE